MRVSVTKAARRPRTGTQMVERKKESDAVAVVLIGHFNPAIFQPQWLASKNLLRQQEADSAVIQLLTADVAAFSAGWLLLQVMSDRFLAQTTDPAALPTLRDFVLGVFSLLEHTPASKMGINRLMHFRMESTEMWHGFGDRLAPKGLWDSVMEGPGLGSMTMLGKRPAALSKAFSVKIEPSTKIIPGIYVEMNDHYEIPDDGRVGDLMKLLRDDWDAFLSHSDTSAKSLLSLEVAPREPSTAQ
jgi:hypothetical protein